MEMVREGEKTASVNRKTGGEEEMKESEAEFLCKIKFYLDC